MQQPVMHISVVIPVYNALRLAKACVESIFAAGSSLIFEVIVVDNGSSPEVETWLLIEERIHANLRHLRYPEPLGFASAVNAGTSAASGEVLVILNSDTVVSPGWLGGLYQALSTDPSLGAVTPYTNQAGEPAQMDARAIDLPASKALALIAAQPNPRHIRHLPQRITFFCVALRSAVWLELGGFDESYGSGNFEDDDLCLRLRIAGYRLGVAQHVFVYHHGNATFHANGIGHDAVMKQNTAVFARKARQCAEDSNPPLLHWPKRPAQGISVVIQPKADAPLDRTLRSLHNQTVRDFEIVLPGSSDSPTRTWIAYITQGDIFYPFHLEALLDALDRTSSDAIFADGWIADAQETFSHPDASARSGQAPPMLAGWMHHSSLDPDRLWEQTVPAHWPRITWEMQQAPSHPPQAGPGREDMHGSCKPSVIDFARRIYRRTVRLETRLTLDARARKLLGLPSSLATAVSNSELKQSLLRELAEYLQSLVASRTDAGRFRTGASLPSVFLFNIIPWDAAVQRPHHFARCLAQRGHDVFWVDTGLRPARNWWSGRPLRQVFPGVHFVQLPGPVRDIYHMPWDPVVLDAMSAALAQVASAYGVRQVVSLVNFPRWQPLAMRAKDKWGWNVIYDCLDDQRAFADLYQTQLWDHEDRLIDAADLLISSSAVLQERLRRRRPGILLHDVLHNAADYDLFSSCVSAGHLRHLPHPVIGFFGVLADWLDADLIRAAAVRFPDWSFVYIGPPSFSNPASEARWLRSTNLPNITVLPQMDPRTLAAHLADFDVCTMPFLDIPVTQTMNPVKLYEYLAAGKPVVSRDLPEVRHLVAGPQGAGDLIALYSTKEEFFEQLQAVAAADTPGLIRQRQEFARHHDWSDRVDVLSREIIRVASLSDAYDTSSISASSKGSNTRSQE